MITPRWKAICAAGALLLTGMAAGAALTVHFGLNFARRIIAAQPGLPAPVDGAMAHLEADWVAAIHLDAKQTAHVHAELARSGEEFKHLRADTVQRLQFLLNDMVVRSATALTPTQREALYDRARQRLALFGLRLTPTETISAPRS